MSQQSYKNEKPTLFLIPTPVGNLEDITIRAINTLKEVEIIFAEDTRESLKLLKRYEIKKTTISLNKDNEKKKSNKVIEYLKQGYSVAIISDGGTPLISDPGYISVKKAIDNNYNVVALPGPTAFVPALISSGIKSDRFLFLGFLSLNKTKREKELIEIDNSKHTAIIYESPHRISNTIEELTKRYKDRSITVSREISKINEEIYRKVHEIISREIILPKGEFVIIIEGINKQEIKKTENSKIIEEVEELKKKGFSEKDSIKKTAKKLEIPKNEVYNLYIKERK